MTFDSSAATYDAAFGASPSGRLFRFHLSERVMERSPPPARVLDIGCGTGDDALWLAGQGYTVRGIDESSSMIAVASSKAERFGSSATFSADSLEHFAQNNQKFDVVISNFGALNCVGLSTWTQIVPRLLTGNGRAFVALMGRKPLPEGFRRGFWAADRGSTAPVRIGSSLILVHYESVAAIISALRDTATVERIEALGCLVPGPGYDGFARRHPMGLGLLAAGEALVRSAPFFRDRGDHTLFEFRAR